MSPETPEDLPTTASEWAVRLYAGALPAHERHAFAQWLAGNKDRLRDVEEAQALLRVSGALRTSDIARAHLAESLRTIDAAASPGVIKHVRTRRVAIAGAVSALAACALIAAVFLPHRAPTTPVLDDNAKVATAVGAIAHYGLSDRSSLTVGASSAVQVAFTDTQREMALDQGKAFFEVTHDADRPFIVKAGSHQVMVTGTKFNVSYNRAKDQLEVAVVEGAVNVGGAHGAATHERVAAGDVTLFPASRAGIARQLTPDQASAWRTGVLYFDDAELDDFLSEVNGYLAKPLVLADAGLSHLTLTAQIPAGDTRAVLFILHEVLGLNAQESPERWELYKVED